MAGDINRVTLVGTPDARPGASPPPDRDRPSSSSGWRSTARQKDEAGNWTDKPNFFDVKVFGNQAEMLSQHLAKGRPRRHRRSPRLVLVGGTGRVEALEGRDRRRSRCSSWTAAARASGEQASTSPQSDVAADQSDFAPAGAAAADDDIPF